jgi:hypothetical protein
MFGSHTLDVAVGMALFFLIVSLMCSAVREAVETILKARAINLERGIRELLDDPSGQNMVKSVFQHAQVFTLFTGDYDPALFHLGWSRVLKGPRHVRDYLRGRRSLPSYIPAGQFAAAVMDIVARGPGTWPYPVAPQAMTVDALRERAAYLPTGRLQRAVLGAIDFGEGDLLKTKANIETWFNGSMDRVSGWYKRSSQIWLFAIGFAAAALLNLDALTVLRRLDSDETLRTAWVAQAEAMKTIPQTPRIGALRSDLDALGAPIGWGRVGRGSDVALRPLPQNCPVREAGICTTQYWPLLDAAWFEVVLGWIITGIAVTFGAPFWFDLLNKFTVIRSTVKPHEKSREEGSKDPVGETPHAPIAGFAAIVDPEQEDKQPDAPPSVRALVPEEAGFVPEEWREPNPAEVPL